MDAFSPMANPRFTQGLADSVNIALANLGKNGNGNGHSSDREAHTCKECGMKIHSYRGILQHINAHNATRYGESAPTEDGSYRSW